VFVGCAFCVLTGCYYIYPTKMPPMHHGVLAVAGQPIEIKTREVKTFFAACSDSDAKDGHCEMHRDKLTNWMSIEHTQFSYGGHNLTYAELRELTDPNWTKVIEQVQQLKSSCGVSIVPSTIALASAAAALIPLLFSRNFSDDQQKYIYIGSAVGFVGFSALSYPIGGHACRKSNESTGAQYDWDLDDWERYPGSQELSDEVLKLASDFNDRVGATPEDSGTTAPTADPSGTSAPVPTPTSTQPRPPAGSDAPLGTINLVAALKAERRFKDFLKVVAAAGMENELATGGPFTLVAPNDYALQLRSRELKQLTADKGHCLRIYKHYVAKGVTTKASLTAHKAATVTMLDGSAIKLTFEEGEQKADGEQIEDQVLDATNGAVFILDKAAIPN